MKKIKNIVLSILLILVLVFSGVGPYVADQLSDAGQFPTRVEAADDIIYVTNVKDAGTVLRDGLKARETEIPVYIRLNEKPSEYQTLYNQIYEEATKHTGVGNEGDYIKYQVHSRSGRISAYTSDYHYVTITFVVEYLSNAEQEAAVDAELTSVYKKLNLTGKSKEEKLETIYDYIADNVTYDYKNLDDDVVYSKWSHPKKITVR